MGPPFGYRAKVQIRIIFDFHKFAPMFKSSPFFVALLLPYLVVAKGKNDGSNGDNAVTTTLMDTDKYRLDIHTYNAKSADIGEFHGDLELQIKTGSISN